MVSVESVVILEAAAWKEALEKLLAHWRCFISIGTTYGLMYMFVCLLYTQWSSHKG